MTEKFIRIDRNNTTMFPKARLRQLRRVLPGTVVRAASRSTASGFDNEERQGDQCQDKYQSQLQHPILRLFDSKNYGMSVTMYL